MDTTAEQIAINSFKQALAKKDPALTHIQTHISHVFLTNQRAYKIKKAVDFGFLNFSTLARRCHFAELERKLNSRLAPGLYEEVFTIDHNGQRTDDPDQMVECVIAMQRFAQDNQLDHFAARNGLDDALVMEMAETIANFHTHAEPAPNPEHYGSSETVWAPMAQNIEQIAPFLKEQADQDRLARLESQITAAFESIKPIIEQRQRSGFIRSCHGDMHLANMAIKDDALLIFDGIEFNDDLRFIDTANDLAFVLMDLHKRRLIGPARLLLNHYLEKSGDYQALAVLPFYMAYRASVRAKIALLTLRDDMSAAEIESSFAEHRAYMQLALELLAPRQPRLFITVGVSASGKSLASHELVLARGAIRVRSDAERQRMFIDKAVRYSQRATEQTYQRLQEIAKIGLNAGFEMTMDATFLKRSYREPFMHLAQSLNVPMHILFMECDAEQVRRFMRERNAQGRDISEADEQVLESQLQQLEGLTPEEAKNAFRLKCDAPLGAQISQLPLD
ncbi:MAG TPA: aminoglycoside phosphotransferase [Halothiobacillaceae bacterium]|nr:aminoglycoside phosphotransferase [Halothiobacillaceae bacterium]